MTTTGCSGSGRDRDTNDGPDRPRRPPGLPGYEPTKPRSPYLPPCKTGRRAKVRQVRMQLDRIALPAVLAGRVSVAHYRQWLYRTSQVHAKRDRKRGWPDAIARDYSRLIHAAVLATDGRCHFTGADLDWERVGHFRASERRGGGAYCVAFDNMPSVDHIHAEPPARFAITSWHLNRAKGSHTWEDFVEFCRRVVAAVDSGQIPPPTPDQRRNPTLPDRVARY